MPKKPKTTTMNGRRHIMGDLAMVSMGENASQTKPTPARGT